MTAPPVDLARVEEIRRRHEDFVRQYSPGPDWQPCSQMSDDRGYLLDYVTRLAEAVEENTADREIARLQAALVATGTIIKVVAARVPGEAHREELETALSGIHDALAPRPTPPTHPSSVTLPAGQAVCTHCGYIAVVMPTRPTPPGEAR